MKEPNFQEILKSKWQYYGMTDAANDFAVQEYARQYHEYLSSFQKTIQYMIKTIGYIPLDKTDTPDKKQHIIINGEWFKLAEVWVHGLQVNTDLWDKTHFKPKEGEEKHCGNACANCGRNRASHKGPDGICPAKDEKIFPGKVKYD